MVNLSFGGDVKTAFAKPTQRSHTKHRDFLTKKRSSPIEWVLMKLETARKRLISGHQANRRKRVNLEEIKGGYGLMNAT